MKTPHNQKHIRLALIGVGAMGSIHAQRLLRKEAARVEPVALCDPNPEVAERFPGLPFFDKWEDLLAANIADAVLVATPHFQHADIGIAALEQDYHVLVEKPRMM